MVVQRDEADSDDGNQLSEDESSDNQAATPQGIQVNEIGDAPNGLPQTSSQISNTSTFEWNPSISNDVLTFGYKNVEGRAATVTIKLSDNSGNGGPLTSGSVSWLEGDDMDEDKYIEFRGFPLLDDQSSVRKQCYSVTSLTNDENKSEGCHVNQRIW